MMDAPYLIRRASQDDLLTIREMAQVVFRHTYRDILSDEQMEYMMDWMYSIRSLEAQLSQGHTYYIAFRDEKPAAMFPSSLKVRTVTVSWYGICKRFM